ncbi:hypothetical protein LPTSP4_33120 [Leptospira ryugenii]|uniref:Uncharacterized protein n=1 Tax=Leptospira ryugenii TaxID=1917863 RepID=A0A2P2E4J4_9LEPT|nr:hypothetical protein [Leptospira ryugenii]GBF51774.1 hypothetical protein LPTSP4_33120 [Leptospira ryugenii]
MKTLRIVFLLFFLSYPLMAGTWIEDSLGFAFEFPRGWNKAVLRNSETARIQFYKSNREAVLQLDVVRRTKEYDLDRFIEESIDLFLKRYTDLKVVREKMLEDQFPSFDESVFLVLHYHENKTLVTNRFLFHKKGNMYYVLQTKTPRNRYNQYAKDFDLIMKSFRMEPRIRTRWRNDSLAYLDPVRDEKAIQYISITIRPIESYPNQEGAPQQSSDQWLNSVEGFRNPFSADGDYPKTEPNNNGLISPPSTSPNTSEPGKNPNTEQSGPVLPPETDPL